MEHPNGDGFNPPSQSNNFPQSSRYATDFLAAWGDPKPPVNPANNPGRPTPLTGRLRNLSDICHCSQCQPVIDRLVQSSQPNPLQQQNQQPIAQQQLSQMSLNKFYHNRAQMPNNTPSPWMFPGMQQGEYPPNGQHAEMPTGVQNNWGTGRVDGRNTQEASRMSWGIQPQSANVGDQNAFYHQRPPGPQ